MLCLRHVFTLRNRSVLLLLTTHARLPLSPHHRVDPMLPRMQTHTYTENGRDYENYSQTYMFPCDEVCMRKLQCSVGSANGWLQEEKDRMDIYHKLFEVARRSQLHSPLIPIYNEQSPRILDLGCGTGIWAIDMAE